MAELKQKLLARGHVAEEVEDAIAWCASNQFQCDIRYAESFARQKAARYGNKLISSKLGDIPFPESSIPDEMSRVVEWIQRKYGSTYAEYRQQQSSHDEFQDKAEFEVDASANELTLSVRQDQQHLKAKLFRQLLSRGFSVNVLEKAWRAWLEKT